MRTNWSRAGLVAPLVVASISLAWAATVVLNFPVTNPAQEHSQWCWAGSSQAILAYYGKTVSQCSIANYASGYPGGARPDCCTLSGFSTGDNVLSGCNYWNYMWGFSAWGVSGGSLQGILSHWSVNSTALSRSLSQAEVRAELDARRPAVMRFGWTGGGGHFLDIYGQEQDATYLDYWDPWPGNGATRSLYSWVVSASDHAWTHTLKLTTNPPATTSLSINDVSVAEGNSGTTLATFTVSLSAASASTVTVGYQTANGTATTGQGDYTAKAGTLSIAPGATTGSIAVPVLGDIEVEPNETFYVNLSNASNATIADGQGVGTIANDDSAPFTDPTLTAGVATIKAVHLAELRSRINGLRARFGLSACTWTDPTLTPAGAMMIKAVHVTEMRAALGQAYAAHGVTPPTYTDPGLTIGSAVKAIHITELRAAVIALEQSEPDVD